MKIEDFVKQNRSAFDDKEPSDKIWKNVEASVGLQRGGWWNSLTLWRAAAVVFMVLSVYMYVQRGGAKQPRGSEMALKEFKDVEAFYVEQISEKVEMIDQFQKNEGLNSFTQDFQQLEAMYMVLKEEMHARPSQKVKDALVLKLLERIDLLNQQLHALEKWYKSHSDKEKKEANI